MLATAGVAAGVRRGRSGRRDDDPPLLELRRCALGDPGSLEQLLGQAKPAAAPDHDRVRGRVVAGPLLGEPAVADPDDPVRDLRRFGVVAHDQRRAAVLPHELPDQAVDDVGGPGVELAGRLVGEEDAGRMRQCRAERDPLLLAA